LNFQNKDLKVYLTGFQDLIRIIALSDKLNSIITFRVLSLRNNNRALGKLAGKVISYNISLC